MSKPKDWSTLKVGDLALTLDKSASRWTINPMTGAGLPELQQLTRIANLATAQGSELSAQLAAYSEASGASVLAQELAYPSIAERTAAAAIQLSTTIDEPHRLTSSQNVVDRSEYWLAPTPGIAKGGLLVTGAQETYDDNSPSELTITSPVSVIGFETGVEAATNHLTYLDSLIAPKRLADLSGNYSTEPAIWKEPASVQPGMMTHIPEAASLDALHSSRVETLDGLYSHPQASLDSSIALATETAVGMSSVIDGTIGSAVLLNGVTEAHDAASLASAYQNISPTEIALGIGVPDPAVDRLSGVLDSYQSRFIVPDQRTVLGTASAGIALTHDKLHIASGLSSTSFLEVAKSLNVAWYDRADGASSLDAIYSVRAIAELASVHRPFQPAVTDNLRGVLGDWTTAATYASENFLDSASRAKIYVEHGFDTSITRVPDAALAKVFVSCGLAPARYLPDGGQIETQDEIDELQFTFRAQQVITTFERRLRAIIDREMTKAIGPNWMKSNLPPGMLASWEDKRGRARRSDRNHPLIEFSDFSDFLPIIQMKSNWNNVFKDVFGEPKESILESLRRLMPTRIAAMHSRVITANDMLFCYVEIRRWGTVIKAIK